MGSGLLAWWRRRLASRGFAGAVLCAIPVAAAALIGFQTSFSGIASGLSAVTNGPGTIPASAQTGPSRTGTANRAMVALASTSGSVASDPGRGSRGAGTRTGMGGPAGSGGGSPGSSSPNSPDQGEATRGVSDTVNNAVNNTTNNAVNNTVGTVNNTVGTVNNTVNDTVGAVNNTVNNTVGGVDTTVNGLLDP